MTSEHVQRLAEWMDKHTVFSDTVKNAQEALDASGATARIEELRSLYEGCLNQASREIQRAEKAEKRIEELRDLVVKIRNFVRAPEVPDPFPVGDAEDTQLAAAQYLTEHEALGWIRMLLDEAGLLEPQDEVALSQAQQSQGSR